MTGIFIAAIISCIFSGIMGFLLCKIGCPLSRLPVKEAAK